MLELVQGEGGVLPLEQSYVDAVKKLCQERDWLLPPPTITKAEMDQGQAIMEKTLKNC